MLWRRPETTLSISSTFKLQPRCLPGFPVSSVPYVNTHLHACLQCGAVCSAVGAPIDTGALVCGKGNHCAGARIARVRLSAHTVWMWSSLPLLRKLQLNHMLPPLRSFQMHHSLLMRHHSSQMQSCSFQTSYRNSPKRRKYPAEGRTPTCCKSGVQSTSPGGRCQLRSPAPEQMRAAAAGAEVGWCRHTGGIGTVAGTAGTADTGASADSTLNKTYSRKHMTVRKTLPHRKQRSRRFRVRRERYRSIQH